MNIVIANAHTYQPSKHDAIVYVGRNRPPSTCGGVPLKEVLDASAFGNPFTMDRYTRTEVVLKYRAWFSRLGDNYRKGLVSAIEEFISNKEIRATRIVLLCWCYPKMCHAEIIRDYLEEHF